MLARFAEQRARFLVSESQPKASPTAQQTRPPIGTRTSKARTESRKRAGTGAFKAGSIMACASRGRDGARGWMAHRRRLLIRSILPVHDDSRLGIGVVAELG